LLGSSPASSEVDERGGHLDKIRSCGSCLVFIIIFIPPPDNTWELLGCKGGGLDDQTAVAQNLGKAGCDRL